MPAAKERQAALLKVLAAAAWADGRLDREEVNRIKELMLRHGLDDDLVREIDALLAAPVSYTRCEELTRELMGVLRSKAERDEALAEVEAIFRADGEIDPAERELLDSLSGIMDAFTSVDGFMSRITSVFRRALGGLRQPGESPGELSRFLRNEVLKRLHDVSAGEWAGEADAASLNYYTLFGAVLGRVADTEGGISPEEVGTIRKVLAERFDLRPPLLDWVVQAVREASSAHLDRQGLLSEFNRVSDTGRRRELLDAAFAVAAADGEIGADELQELRLISNFLWLDPREYHALRRKWEAHVR